MPNRPNSSIHPTNPELSEITTVTCFWMHSKATSRIMIATMMIPTPLNPKNHGDSNAVGFGGKIRSLFVPFSRRTVGVILFAIAGVLLVVSLVSMAKTAAVNKKHDSNPTPSEQPTLSGYRYSGRRHADSADRRKRHGFNGSAGITKILTAHRAPEISARPAPVSGAPTSAPVTDAPKTQIPAPATTTPGGGGRPTNPPATPTTAPSTDEPIVRPTPGDEPTEPITDSPTDEPVVTDVPTDEPEPPTEEPAPEPTEAPTEPPVTPEEPGNEMKTDLEQPIVICLTFD